MYEARTQNVELWAVTGEPMIDAIDRVLAQHCCFTDKDLNYAIRYRFGQDGAEEDGDE